MTTNTRLLPEARPFRVSDAWKAAYPGAHAGVLMLAGVSNPASSAALERRKSELEAALRGRYAGQQRGSLREDATLAAYQAHYRRFGKTYHVQLQLESIVFKDKPIPGGAALVEAMFMAELDNLLLTAGHDLDAIQLPLTLDVAQGSENYILLRGTEQTPKSGDMMISDSAGIISSVVYGPDQRTQIRADTGNAVFTVYAPVGISPQAVEQHLKEIEGNARLIEPGATAKMLEIFG